MEQDKKENVEELRKKEKDYIIINKPEIYFNILQKQIRKSPLYAKLFINTKHAEVLTIETENIPNSLYLTKINDTTILEILLKKYEKVFKGLELEKRIEKNPEILEIYLKNKISPIDSKNTDEFLLKTYNGTTLLGYVLNNIGYDWEQDTSNLVTKIRNNERINEIVVNYLINQEIIKQEYTSLIRIIIETTSPENKIRLYKKHLKSLKDSELIKEKIIEKLDRKTVNYLFETKEYEILKEIKEIEILNIKLDDKDTLFSKIVKNKIKEKDSFYNLGPLLKELVDNNMYESLEKIIDNNYNLLLYKYDNENTVLETMISKFDFMLKISEFWKKIEKKANNDIRYTKIFLKNNRWDNLLNINESIMNSKYDENNTYFDILIQYVKSYLDKGYASFLSLSPICKRILLYKYKEKTVLEHLLQKGIKEDVLFRIEQNHLQEDVEIQTILKLNNIDITKIFGYEFTEYNIENALNTQKKDLTKQVYGKYLKGKISGEQQKLLDQIKTIFSEDGRSDKEIIELACNSFKYSFLNNYKYTERDINSLINIKINNPEFILIKERISVFDHMGIIAISEIYNLDTFNHELGHAIHWYATEDRIPENFQREQIQINEENYNNFINNYIEERMMIRENLKQKNIDYYSENETAQKDSKDYRKKIEKILEEAEKTDTYSKEIIDYLKNNITVEEEYKNYYNQVITKEIAYLYQEDYKPSIIDIVDAIKKGKIYDDGIEIGYIKTHIGHGSEYFINEKKMFAEIVAEYQEIIKTPHREEALKVLESIVGKDLIDLLEQFNEELVVEPLEHKKQR